MLQNRKGPHSSTPFPEAALKGNQSCAVCAFCRRNKGFAEVEIRSALRPIRQSLQGVLRLGVVEPRGLDAVVDDGVEGSFRVITAVQSP